MAAPNAAAWRIRDAAPDEIDQVRAMLREYAAELGVDLVFQDFEGELAALPGDYVPPRGRMLVAEASGELIGCIALRPLEDARCEMKRLYLRPAARGTGLGAALARRLIDEARAIGYSAMRLDTMPDRMRAAHRLYLALGFREIAPYYWNPIAGAAFLELDLTAGDRAG